MHRRILPVLGAMLVLGLVLLSTLPVFASPQSQTGSTQPTPTPDPRLSISNEVCLACHGQPGQTLTLENGDVLDLYVPASEYNTSIHGIQHYACVQCHRTIGEYPHPPFQAKDLRDASLQLYPACEGCHQHQYELAQDSVHAAAFQNGQREAAVCTDCHSAHAVRRLTDPDTHKILDDAHVWVPATCSKCHSTIYEKYKDSVHGSALLGEGNPDVPTCIDCHGVHNIENPTTASFRLRSPEMCARCHTDETIMSKYGLSTDVLNTYVSDFHGTTVTLFEKVSPDAETNKPVCYDCHGIHDISRGDDPIKGLQVRENILARCQVCHPDATANFPTAWMSHYIPSPDRNPIVYYVNLFYKFLIPTVLGGMALLVVLDLNKTVGARLWKSRTRTIKKPTQNNDTAAGEAAPDGTPDTLLTSEPVEPDKSGDDDGDTGEDGGQS